MFARNKIKATGLVLLSFLIVWGFYWWAFGGRIVTWDGVPQLLQIIGIDNPNDFQTYSATAIMGIFIKLSAKFTSNVNHQIIFYVMVQLLTSIVAVTFIVVDLLSNGFKKAGWFAWLFYLLFPLFPLYAIAFDKSGYFMVGSALFALSVLMLQKTGKRVKYGLVGVLGATLMILFRDDGVYIVVATLGFMVLFSRLRKSFLIMLGVAFLLFVGVTKVWYPNVPVQHANGGGAALSLPTQQLARIQKYGGRIDRETYTGLNEYLPMAELKDKYDENYADPVKFSYRYKVATTTGKTKNPEKTKSDVEAGLNKYPTGRFVKLWFKAVSENKRIALESVLRGVDAYFLPTGKVNESSYLGQLYFGVSTPDTRSGWQNLWGHYIPGLTIYGNNNAKLANDFKNMIFNLPSLLLFKHVIFAAWTYTWLLVGISFVALIRFVKVKKYMFANFGVAVLGIAALGIAMLSPIDGAMRYVMTIIVSLPVLFAMAGMNEYNKTTANESVSD
ncbi:DUF6020 family protein [Weissella confusa]|uniref:DUF6020 family protein n=1 Tax=Weissella confusa TaxID=1583 RepID=UPI0022E01FBF|nr:DUF6020 family protein [Weissella confusa]